MTIQASPSTRRAAAAHPAVLIHAATGPSWPDVLVGSDEERAARSVSATKSAGPDRGMARCSRCASCTSSAAASAAVLSSWRSISRPRWTRRATRTSSSRPRPRFDGGSDPALPALVRRVEMDPIALVATAWQLRRRIRELRPDVVLAHGGWAAQVAAAREPATRPARGVATHPRLLGRHDARPRARRWWRVVCRRLDAAVALSPEMEHELRALGFTGPSGRSRTSATRALRRRRPRRRERSSCAELGDRPEPALLGLVGHLIEQKRPEPRARRARTRRTQPAPTPTSSSRAPGRSSPRSSPSASSCRSRRSSTCSATATDVEIVLGAIDLLLLTSDGEGIPGIVIEAQMAGCPVVTYPVGAVARSSTTGTPVSCCRAPIRS